MKLKRVLQRAADVLMTLALLFLMGYQFWGETAHEWVGAGMLACFLLHHGLNAGWHRRLFKGRYTPARVLTLCVDALLLVAMLMLMYSGIVLSRRVFAFLPIEGGLALARRLHILGSYWGFLLMSVHLGLHWNLVLSLSARRLHLQPSRGRNAVSRTLCAIIAGYGTFVFFKRDFPTYLFLRSEFVFLDYAEPVLRFYLDMISLMGLCIVLAHFSGRLCRAKTQRRGVSPSASRSAE